MLERFPDGETDEYRRRVTKPPKKVVLAPAVPPWPVHRFTVDEYHKMIETGVLSENHRVELIHGWIVAKMTINPPHSYAVTALMEQLIALGATATVRVQQPITTTDSEPEPDVVLAVGSKSDYKTRNPKPSECIIVVGGGRVIATRRSDDQTGTVRGREGRGVLDRKSEGPARGSVHATARGQDPDLQDAAFDYGPDDVVPVVIAGQQHRHDRGEGTAPVKLVCWKRRYVMPEIVTDRRAGSRPRGGNDCCRDPQPDWSRRRVD